MMNSLTILKKHVLEVTSDSLKCELSIESTFSSLYPTNVWQQGRH